jgi:single-stranded-DNA-specific exonuclease
LRVDLEVPIDDVGDDLEKLVRHFEPFGVGNPAPLFRAGGVLLSAPPRRVGSDGLKFSFAVARGVLDGIGWGLAGRAPELDVAQRFDVAFKLDRDEYRGASRLQLRVADVRPTGD